MTEKDKSESENLAASQADRDTPPKSPRDKPEKPSKSIEKVNDKKSKNEPSATNKPKKMNGTDNKKGNGLNRTLIKFFAVILLGIALLGAGAAGGYYWIKSELTTRDQQQQDARAQMDALETTVRDLRSQVDVNAAAKTNALADVTSRLRAAEQRLQAQQKRILAMSTTSREDWLLAEAEYLLKLANQRVLIERQAGSAIGLFEEADAILRDLADPDLFSLREIIKRDLTALKLAHDVDVEGIYLELSAIAGQVENLPLVPQAFNYGADQQEGERANDETRGGPEEDIDSGHSFIKFWRQLDQYYRLIDHEEKAVAILPPEQTAYLHLNLRFMIERAQTALLREQSDIYKDSLNEAALWVKKYFPRSQQSEKFVLVLGNLAQADILRELPDVSESLSLLNQYISDMHKLAPKVDKKKVETNTSTNTTTEAL